MCFRCSRYHLRPESAGRARYYAGQYVILSSTSCATSHHRAEDKRCRDAKYASKYGFQMRVWFRLQTTRGLKVVPRDFHRYLLTLCILEQEAPDSNKNYERRQIHNAHKTAANFQELVFAVTGTHHEKRESCPPQNTDSYLPPSVGYLSWC